MEFPIRFNDELPENLSSIKELDYWIYNHLTAKRVERFREEYSFEALALIFVYRGECIVKMKGKATHVKEPTLVNFPTNSKVQLMDVSDDFKAAVLVIGADIEKKLSAILWDSRSYIVKFEAHELTPRIAIECRRLFLDIEEIINDKGQPMPLKALFYTLVAFYFRWGSGILHSISADCVEQPGSDSLDTRFLKLVAEYAAEQKNLEFYAHYLGMTPKYLSKRIRELTGFPCSYWIERQLLMDATTLLKDSRLSMKDVAGRLNFATPSAFGKFFKNHTGISPLRFRTMHLAGDDGALSTSEAKAT